jgi:hypothetical protein
MSSVYALIKVGDLGSYVQPISQVAKLSTAIENEIDGNFEALEVGESLTLKITRIEMTDEEYKKLPEFEGY